MSKSSKGQPPSRKQGAKYSDAASKTGLHPNGCKHGRPRDSSQIQSRVPITREAHDDKADPGSSWKSIHQPESGLGIETSIKHSLGNTRQVHTDGTHLRSSREVDLQVWSRPVGAMGKQRYS